MRRFAFLHSQTLWDHPSGLAICLRKDALLFPIAFFLGTIRNSAKQLVWKDINFFLQKEGFHKSQLVFSGFQNQQQEFILFLTGS